MKLPALLLVVAAGAVLSLGALRSGNGTGEIRSQTTYFANGQIDTECTLKNNQRDGICRRFYSDGSKLAEGSYAAGKMVGEWTFWRRDGELDAERSGTYVGGAKVGR
ncbi:MAG: toxin-antitoxin system YwqK family antitoxin [Planctomycetota bacterium]